MSNQSPQSAVVQREPTHEEVEREQFVIAEWLEWWRVSADEGEGGAIPIEKVWQSFVGIVREGRDPITVAEELGLYPWPWPG